jgi:hypothetical protein
MEETGVSAFKDIDVNARNSPTIYLDTQIKV